MYAVIETGGKQYRVEVGTELEVELLDVEAGQDMRFDRVLLVADGDTAAIGHPVVTNAEVAARVLGRDRGVKTISFKYRPKARRRVKKGHRQELTLLRISDIVLDGHSAADDVAKEEAARKIDRTRLEEAARRQAAADAELAAKLAAEKPVAEAPPAVTRSRRGSKAESPAASEKTTKGESATGSKAEAKGKGASTKPAGSKTSKPPKAATAKGSAPADKRAATKSATEKTPAKRTKKES